MFRKDLSQTVHLWGGRVWTSNGIAHRESTDSVIVCLIITLVF